MAHPILMPKPGQMTEECTLVAWHRQEGEPVHRGDVLFEIETDKSNMDVEAFDDGVLLRRYVEEGQTVPVNSLVAYVGEPGEAVPDEAPPVLGAGPAEPGAVTEPTPSPAVPAAPPAAPAPVPAPAAAPAAPAVAAPAVAAPAAPVAAVAAPVAPAPAAPTPAAATESGRLRISPRASRAAAAAGLDPRTLTGTGPMGRITERDVRSAIAAGLSGEAAAAPAPAAPPPPSPAPETAVAEDVDWRLEPMDEGPRPMSRMRRVIAQRLTESVTTIPHFTVTVAVDMTRLVGLRQELRDAGTTLSVTDFILAAATQSLIEFPEVNSRTDGTSVWLRRRVHLGLAVSIPGGLVVPVIRDAQRLTVLELHDQAAAVAGAARAGTLSPDDMTGSTFTVSNLGMFAVDEFSAIINPGEAAILAVSSVVPTPVAIGDGVTVRQVMKLTLSADHRLVDGELGARFLNAVRRRLEDAGAFRSEIAGA